VDLWAVSESDQPLYVGYTMMDAAMGSNLNDPPNALVPYHVTVVETDPPRIEGRSRTQDGDPVANARVTRGPTRTLLLEYAPVPLGRAGNDDDRRHAPTA